MEEVFELLRQRSGALSGDAVDTVLACLDALSAAVDAIEDDGEERLDPGPLKERLRALVRSGTEAADRRQARVDGRRQERRKEGAARARTGRRRVRPRPTSTTTSSQRSCSPPCRTTEAVCSTSSATRRRRADARRPGAHGSPRDRRTWRTRPQRARPGGRGGLHRSRHPRLGRHRSTARRQSPIRSSR